MLELGDVVAADLPALPPLLAQLGYPAAAEDLPGRIARIRSGGGGIVVAREDGAVLGVLTLAFLPLLHHERPLARISALVVAEAARGRGIGRRLVAEAERLARARGCDRIEVTSAGHRAAAHAFYAALGYTDKPKRFIKVLD